MPRRLLAMIGDRKTVDRKTVARNTVDRNTGDRMTVDRKRLAVALVVAALTALAVAARIASVWPIEKIMPAFFDDAVKLSQGQAITTFVPLGYAAIISGWLKDVPTTIRVVHFVSLIGVWATTAAALAALQRRGPARAAAMPLPAALWAAFWALTLLFNAPFLVGLVRVSDTGVDILFVAIVFAAALVSPRAPWTVWATCGVVMGLFAFTRPNAATLFVFFAGTFVLTRNRPVNFAVMLVAAILYYAVLSKIMVGVWMFRPENGGYNLFAGANPFSMAELARNYNAEYSIRDGLVWCGRGAEAAGDLYTLGDTIYSECARRFIAENPVEFLKLAFYKGYTMLFRPNMRLADSATKTALQLAVVAPAYLWWAALALNSAFRRSYAGRAGALFVVCYTLPFVLTNADPRFRIPLDVVYAMSALAFAARQQSVEKRNVARTSFNRT